MRLLAIILYVIVVFRLFYLYPIAMLVCFALAALLLAWGIARAPVRNEW